MANTKFRRERLEIIATMVTHTKVPCNKTAIMYKSNLSFEQLNEYLQFVLSNDLISKTTENEKVRYQATETGLAYLQRYHELIKLLGKPNGNNNSEP